MPMIKCEDCEIRKELDLSMNEVDYCKDCKSLLYKKRVSDIAIESIKYITKLVEKVIKKV